MDLKLEGKRALVTGSTLGIGHAIARRLAREGAHVVLHGRTAARVDAAIAELRHHTQGAAVTGVAADLSTPAGSRIITELVPEVDVLVNNAGIYGAKPFEQLDDRDWHTTLEVNLLAGARLAQYYLPRMLAHGGGRIIFISSESAVQIPVEMIHYGVSKTAQAALARGLAEMTRGTTVTVNSVLAGPTRSEGVAEFVGGVAREQGTTEAQVEADFFSTLRPSSLLQRFATPDEVADVVAFVASPVASAINGAAVRADGGTIRAVF
jgi:NAD(P)-dependent dehydrogenase (short-subunit alcohol dehydrogenase family)